MPVFLISGSSSNPRECIQVTRGHPTQISLRRTSSSSSGFMAKGVAPVEGGTVQLSKAKWLWFGTGSVKLQALSNFSATLLQELFPRRFHQINMSDRHGSTPNPFRRNTFSCFGIYLESEEDHTSIPGFQKIQLTPKWEAGFGGLVGVSLSVGLQTLGTTVRT